MIDILESIINSPWTLVGTGSIAIICLSIAVAAGFDLEAILRSLVDQKDDDIC